MEPELGAEERDQPVDAGARPRRPRDVVGDEGGERVDPRPQRLVALDGLLRERPEVAEEADGVPARQGPAVRVDVPEDGRAVGRPAPAVVVGDRREGLQAVGEAFGERLDP